MDEILLETENRMQSAIENMEKRFTNVRAGRANPAILDGIMVAYYGTDTPLKQLATIFEANIGLTPNNLGDTIILNIPALTEETRKDYVKQVKQIAEDARIALRNIRQDANNDIKKLDDITEDDKKGTTEDVQELINTYNKKVDELLQAKEQELLQV